MKTLAEKGINVELRIDPLFPSDRINRELHGHDELTHALWIRSKFAFDNRNISSSFIV